MVIKTLSKSGWGRTLIYLISLLASTGASAFTVAVDEAHPFGIYYDDETPLEFKDGAAKAEFLFEIPEKHYLYKESLRVEFEDERIAVDIDLPPAEIKQDQFQNKEVEVYYHQLAVPVTLAFADGMETPSEVSGTIYYQGCSHELCFRLMKQPFTFKVVTAPAPVPQVTGAVAVPPQGTPPAEVAPVPPVPSDGGWLSLLSVNDIGALFERGLGVTFLITFLAGVLTGFTPCVLPVIPLTLTFMGVSDGQKGGAKLVSLCVFVAGLVLMYSALGVGSALIGKTFGFWYQSRTFLILLVIFFLAMGLWMWGALDFAVPARLQTAIVRYQPRGHFRQLYSGLTIGVLAAPCVGPIAGPLLVYVSISKNILMGGLLMTSYALGLSVLFFILGFFSRNWVRRFGERSGVLKKALGTLLIVTAAFYAYVLVKPYVAIAKKSDAFFRTSYVAAEREARSSGKGVLVDFYADWCLPCQEWSNNVWTDTGAQAKIKERFVPVKIDCTEETGECKRAVEKFGVIGWPTIVFLDGDMSEFKSKRLVGRVMDAGEFVEYLGGIK